MTYLVIRALHLISIVSFFAGLFYIVRLFIYHTEAQDRPETERKAFSAQFEIMERRLWFGITIPAWIAALGFGTWLATLQETWPDTWLHAKLALIGLLQFYVLHIGRIRRSLAHGVFKYGSRWLRMYNEVATLFLVAMVFIAVTKTPAYGLYGVFWVLVFGAVVMMVLKMVRGRG